MNPGFKEEQRLRRHRRVRRKVFGTQTRPRLAVHRSHLHLVAQVLNDTKGTVLLSLSTRDPDFRKSFPRGGNVEAAKHLGQWVAKRAVSSGIKKMVFDRSGFPYHGRVKALAEALREQGVEV